MKDELQKLVALAKLDAEIVEILDLIEETPRLISSLEKETAKIESPLSSLTRELNSALTQKKLNESALVEKREWIASREEKNKELKTNKEYHSALKEVTEGQKVIFKLEESIKALDLVIDDRTQKIAGLKTEIEEKTAEIRSKIALHQDAVDKSRAHADDKMKNRDEFEKTVKDVVLKKYRAIFNRQKPAISLAEHGLCNECNTKIPPQLYIELQKTDILRFCPQCHRILYLGV